MQSGNVLIKALLLMILLLTGLSVLGQGTVDVSNSGSYYMDGDKLYFKDLDLLFSSSSVNQSWQDALKSRRTSIALGFVGGFGIGWYIGYRVRPPLGQGPFINTQVDRKNRIRRGGAIAMLVMGAGCTVSSILLKTKYKEKTYKVAATYNKDILQSHIHRPSLDLSVNGTGLGIAYKF